MSWHRKPVDVYDPDARADCVCGRSLAGDVQLLKHVACCPGWQTGERALRQRVVRALELRAKAQAVFRSEPDRVPAWAPAEEHMQAGQGMDDAKQTDPPTRETIPGKGHAPEGPTQAPAG